jgi:hypothetical protein
MKDEVSARACCKFSHTFEELIRDQGEIATIMEYDSQDSSASILSYSPIPNAISTALSTLQLCNETRLPLFVPLAHLLLGTCLVLHKQDFLHHYCIYSNTIWSSSGYL